jgi:5'-3' exoribonuclease 1
LNDDSGSIQWKDSFAVFKEGYYMKKMDQHDPEKVCHEYIRGLHWVLKYYLEGIPDWTWCFPYDYAPFLSDIASSISTYKHYSWPETTPFPAFKQLLSVLPPKSSYLLPAPLNKVMTNNKCPLHPFYPTDFEIDLGGKRREWQGIVRLPKMDLHLLNSVYINAVEMVDEKDAKRNVRRKERVWN